jgi:hypothetical protein
MSYPVLLGAIVITSLNRRLRFREAAGTVGNVDLDDGTYYLRDNSFATHLATKLSAFAAGGNTYAVSVSFDINPANRGASLTITRTGTDTFGLVKDGSQTFDYDLIGFSASTANDGNPKTSDKSAAAAWVGNDILREREPFGERMVSVPRKVNGGVVGVTRSAHMTSWSLGFAFVHEDRMLIRAHPTDVDATLEAFMRRFGAGASFEAYEEAISAGTVLAGPTTTTNRFGVLHWSEDTLGSFRPQRIGPGVPLYDLDAVAHEQVT